MKRRGTAVAVAVCVVAGLAGCFSSNAPPPEQPLQCALVTCSASQCGPIPDGCGGVIDCGACPDPDPDPDPGQCRPETCLSLGKNCGAVQDGCGGTLSCGACERGTCGGGGVEGVCGGPDFGGPGPWPMGNVTYGAADGILEQPVVGMSTDEAQNLWVATRHALYLLRPGETRFTRFDSAAGLHLADNPVGYCDDNFAGGDKSCPIFGAATERGITAITGGGPGEVFVGYAGEDEGPGDWSDLNRHSGKVDRVRLMANGSLQVDRFDLASGGHGAQYWHNRTVFRLVFDHFIHRHDLYAGTNHGVTLLKPDLYRPPPIRRGYVGFDWGNTSWMGDHLHARVCYHAPCDDTESNQRMGNWRGLAINAAGDLWTAGRWTAGLIRWHPDPLTWFSRPGNQAFVQAFGDPYPRPPNDNGFVNEPVFRVPMEGDPVNLSAVAVAPDGRVWFASTAFNSGDIAYGVASWDGRKFHVYDPVTQIGMAERDVIDLVALPDGRLVLAGPTTGLTIWNPSTGERASVRAGQGLPDDRVQRLELDTMVSPPALHVATQTGAASLRQLP